MKLKSKISKAPPTSLKEVRYQTSSLQSSIICLLYYFLLSAAYKLEVASKWGAAGFENDVSFIYITISIFSIFIFFYSLGNKSDFRALILIFAFLSIYVPAMVYLSLGNPHLWLGFSYFTSFFIIFWLSKIYFVTLRVKTLPKTSFVILLLAFIGFALLLLALRAGFGNINFGIYAVYDFRRDIAEDIGVQLNTALSIVSKFIIPLFFIYAISMRNNFRFLLIIIGAILLIAR